MINITASEFVEYTLIVHATDEDSKRRIEIGNSTPGITIFLQPISPPAVSGLAGFAGSTWITAGYIADWWGQPDSPIIFFSFVAIFGRLAQFIAELYGFGARDTLAAGALPFHQIHTRFPELASYFIIMTVTWSCAIVATARDIVLCACFFSSSIGSTIACCLYSYNGGTGSVLGDGLGDGVTRGIKAASHLWIFAALCAWWRVTVYLI
ncbi:hypothetical protein HD806DRAFT_532483 [Xylariaceae sp. AK1471]|nr:hypothetical protein HD806DRAFT_532483 [Xylariaceae sp. AK1471]